MSFKVNYNSDLVLSPLPQDNSAEQQQSSDVANCLICFDDLPLCSSVFGCPYCYPAPVSETELPPSMPPFCPSAGIFRVRGCRHICCKDCVIRYLEEKISNVGRADVSCHDFDKSSLELTDSFLISNTND